MLNHIVMWKFRDGEGKTRKENIECVKESLEALSSKIPELISLSVITNELVNDANFDAMLVVCVADEIALEKYKTHPEHQNVAGYIGNVTESRAAIDYYCEA